MKRAYQIDERKAIDRFRSYLQTNPGSIQLVLPLADVANGCVTVCPKCCSRPSAMC